MNPNRTLFRHPILVSVYEAALAVESCGASPELTNAVVLVSGLKDKIHDLLDTITPAVNLPGEQFARDGFPCTIEEADFSANTVLLKMAGNYTVCAGPHMLVPSGARATAPDMIALPVVDLLTPLESIETSEADAQPWNPPAGYKAPGPKPNLKQAMHAAMEAGQIGPGVDAIMDMADKYAHADNAFEGGMLRMALQVAINDRWANVVSAAERDVLQERTRQVLEIGATAEHDDMHVNEELAALAAFYAMPPAARDWDATSTSYGATLGEAMKPIDWDVKVGDRRRELLKSAALAIAEIERLDRAEERAAAF